MDRARGPEGAAAQGLEGATSPPLSAVALPLKSPCTSFFSSLYSPVLLTCRPSRASLSPPWPPRAQPCRSPAGDVYYFNFSTGESVWDHPCDDYYRGLYAEEKAK